jgi:hypothetical protein
MKDLHYTFFLGAADGLLFGISVEILRRIFTPIIRDRHMRHLMVKNNELGLPTPSYTEYIGDYIYIPLLCLLIFAVTSLVLNHYWKKRPSSLVLTWQIIGITATTLVFIAHQLTAPPFHWVELLPPLPSYLLCLLIAVFINLLFGIILDSLNKKNINQYFCA